MKIIFLIATLISCFCRAELSTTGAATLLMSKAFAADNEVKQNGSGASSPRAVAKSRINRFYACDRALEKTQSVAEAIAKFKAVTESITKLKDDEGIPKPDQNGYYSVRDIFKFFAAKHDGDKSDYKEIFTKFREVLNKIYANTELTQKTIFYENPLGKKARVPESVHRDLKVAVSASLRQYETNSPSTRFYSEYARTKSYADEFIDRSKEIDETVPDLKLKIDANKKISETPIHNKPEIETTRTCLLIKHTI